ncbi:Hypothetical protein D9617_121g039650 [Elsinoe fawcettii]|nr:Hypothetical protein D9617_121g039650 [Elsinoe fawcettii]
MLGGSGYNSLDAFETELEELAKEEHSQLVHWRRHGPVGKLHNIVTWISRSPQRMEAFSALQKECTTSDEDQLNAPIYKFQSKLAGGVRLNPKGKVSHLTHDEWEILKQYYRIFKPLSQATIKLQGQVGRHGNVWEVLPIFDLLLSHPEHHKELVTVEGELTVQQAYPQAEELWQEAHFKFNINLAWKKLDEYYTLTGRTPAYLASTVLHPRYNWDWSRHWSEWKDWIKSSESIMLNLWQQYRDRPNIFTKEDTPHPSRPPEKRRRGNDNAFDDDDDFILGYSSEDEPQQRVPSDQYKDYTSAPSNRAVMDPF